MKLFSAELLTTGDKKKAKAVVIQKKQSSYTLIRNYITEPDNLKPLSAGLPINICIDYYDTIIETLTIPPVKDSGTLKLMAMNKLKDKLEEGEDYLLAYRKKDEEPSGDKTGGVEHTVYFLPDYLFEKECGLTEDQKLRTDIFTLSEFALCGVSSHYFPDETVFHAYADEAKMTVTVSHGKNIVYTRAIEYSFSSEASMDSVFYEGLNLTYMFVSKNMRKNIDRMILSGLLSDKPDLSEMLFEFNKKPQTVLLSGKLIENCSREIFQKFMIPISLCLLEDSYDFTPEHYKVNRGFNYLKAGANIFAFCTVLLLLYMNITSLNNFSFARKKLISDSQVIDFRISQNIESFKDSEDKRYGLYYYKELERYSASAFDIFPEVADILETGKYKSVRMGLGENGPEIYIEGEMTFDNFKDIDAYRENVESRLERLKANPGYKVDIRSQYSMEKMIAVVKIHVEQVKSR